LYTSFNSGGPGVYGTTPPTMMTRKEVVEVITVRFRCTTSFDIIILDT
jgi:ATP sulfurylase